MNKMSKELVQTLTGGNLYEPNEKWRSHGISYYRSTGVIRMDRQGWGRLFKRQVIEPP